MAVTFHLIVTIVLSICGASFQFYSFAVLNTPQVIVESWVNRTYFARNGRGFTESELTLFWSFIVGSNAIGAFLGCLLIQFIAETLGRRNGLIANGVLNVLGGLMCGIAKIAKSAEVFILGRFFMGICMGLGSGLVPMYLTEIAPIKYRGAAGTAHMIAVAFGDWFSLCLTLPQIFGGEDLWPLAVAFPAIPAAILVIFLPFCAESPRYLLIRHKSDEAMKAIQFFVGEDTDAVHAAFDTLLKEVSFSSQVRCFYQFYINSKVQSVIFSREKGNCPTCSFAEVCAPLW